ncbi:MAG: TonB-dependent receptor [Thermodesulfobacteriota bacterium]|nr:TonB-dependent receptor [Thermodesulfobacteriota bacterium]
MLVLLYWMVVSATAHAWNDGPELLDMSLEDLMNIEITSVSKKPQKFSEAASAIFVITQEDIRRSGATSIPEVLRMVPGLHVGKIDANIWAVTARGFNGRFANKLLVLMDGRSLYTPAFSGVYWDVQDTLLEDVDRIEVIRGPGATLWGANAVNGVINIITKKAKDTEGGLVSGGIGTEEQGFGGVRYGGKVGDAAYYRIYAKYFNRDGGVDASGYDTTDDWDALRAGFRVDWQAGANNAMTLQGDVYDGKIGETIMRRSLVPPFQQTRDARNDLTGAHVLGRWARTLSHNSDMELQLYYDRNERDFSPGYFIIDTFDVDFHHRFQVSKRQEIMWGLGYRLASNNVDGNFDVTFSPDSREDHLFSLFVQDEILLLKDRLYLTMGSKFEHNDYTDFEIQPSARMMWTPRERHSAWAAVSRAVRTPSWADHDIRINNQVLPPDLLYPGSPPVVTSLFGDRDFESEELLAYEIGYRVQPTETLSLDMAAFYNDYDNLRSFELEEMFPEDLPPPEHLVIPLRAGNKMDGSAYGIELAAEWRPSDWWRLKAAYTYLQEHLDLDGDSQDVSSEAGEGENPHHQLSLRSCMDLPRNVELDMWARYVDNLPSQDVGSYVTLDARLSWRPKENLELSLVGQNLLDDHHPEFVPEIIDTSPSEVERSVYGKIIWQF